jgi:hypothetical protein
MAAFAGALVSGGVAAQDAAPAEAATAEGDTSESRPPSAGYTWTDKAPAKSRPRWTSKPIDPQKPLATYPGFRMMPDGTSQIWLRISKKVPVTMRQAAGRVSFVLPEVQIGVRNNTNPLVTTHFDTPVSRAGLTRGKDAAVLVVELREAATLSHRVIDGPRGTMVLVVEAPKAQKKYSVLAPEAVRQTAPRPEPSQGTPRTLPKGSGPRP